MKSDAENITERVVSLEKFRADMEKSIDIEIGSQIREFSRMQALEIVVMELAVHLGVPVQRVKTRLDELQGTFHQQHLEEAERESSSFAARIDDRSLDEVPTDKGSGRLFPPTKE